MEEEQQRRPAQRRPVQRSMTERRKDQNRRAQKAYRARKKDQKDQVSGENVESRQIADVACFQQDPQASGTGMTPADWECFDLNTYSTAIPSLDAEAVDFAQSSTALDSADGGRQFDDDEGGNSTLFEDLGTGISHLSNEMGVPETGEGDDSQTSFPATSRKSSFQRLLGCSALNAHFALPPPIANLQRNHLHLPKLNIIAACLANAATIGVDANKAMALECKYVSPFYQTWQSFGDTETAHGKYAHVKSDLRPSTAQITEEHGIYLDLLPFPEFRDRVLALRKVGTPIFNEAELTKDLDAEGLVCWGTRDTGTPWSPRSWEAKPWFLRKWWMVVGSEDSEIFQTSRWYWDQRGEQYKDTDWKHITPALNENVEH